MNKRFLIMLGLVAASVIHQSEALGLPAMQGESLGREEYRLKLRQVHTGESLDVAYRVGDQYLPSSLALLNHFLRDYRTGDDGKYDTASFDLLHAILLVLHRPRALIEVICGYRTPATNAYLRLRSPVTGVAENSQHTLSRAIDINIPGVSTERLRDAALSLKRGGVGYYPSSHFVHVDVGPVREWSFGVRRHLIRHHHQEHGKPHGTT